MDRGRIYSGKTTDIFVGRPDRRFLEALIGTEGSDAYQWHKNVLIRQSDLGHGETKRDTVTISRDGETMTIRDRSTTPNGVALATLVMRRQQ
jgi:hypothetical protein